MCKKVQAAREGERKWLYNNEPPPYPAGKFVGQPIGPWRPMESAPRDGTMLRLLVDFTDHATEDSADPSPTIGANNFDHDGEDRWLFAGWCWTHDHFTQGEGTPIGWLPMLDIPATQPAGAAVEAVCCVHGAPWQGRDCFYCHRPQQRSEQVAGGGGVDAAWLDKARELYDGCKLWPENSGAGMIALLGLRNHVATLLAAQAAPQQDDTPQGGEGS